jgi:hypothetical protein
MEDAIPLEQVARLGSDKVLNATAGSGDDGIRHDKPLLMVLAAGKGTRFGKSPKCIQPVHGVPLARHAIDAFRRQGPFPVICLVGYRHEEVAAALGDDNIYVRSDNPAGGTAFAAWEAFCVDALSEHDPLVVITMGDRIVPAPVFEQLLQVHRQEPQEADLTFLTAIYEAPRNQGKGRILRDEQGRVLRIVEQRDIDEETDPLARSALSNLTEGNCPLYAIRASLLKKELARLSNANAQQQYYLTDIVTSLSQAGADIRTVTTTPSDPEYDLLCSDVTRPQDMALLEGIMSASAGTKASEESEIRRAAERIAENRPAVQIEAVAGQIETLCNAGFDGTSSFLPDQPVAIGIAGGRLRIAFMHPDMERFFGPAWQMPIGSGTPDGQEQIVVMVQETDDRQIHLYPLNPQYREKINAISSDNELMYPPEEVHGLHAYEKFGTHMSEHLLLSLGYFSEEELQRRIEQGLPLPPASLWVESNMRRPFPLVANAIASIRTLRQGTLGARVSRHLGRQRFQGLRIATIGSIPQGGFSSSSAMTVAVKNALNTLFDLGIPADLLIHLAAQAEYGTGVRAGSLDQATVQKGRAGCGTLISSNPGDNYCILDTCPVPADRIQILFPYSVPRDREAWRWSRGVFGPGPGSDVPTAGELRKLTGKTAEIAAILTDLPEETDFFKVIEDDFLRDGFLGAEKREWVASVLRQLPLRIAKDELRRRVLSKMQASGTMDEARTHAKAETLFEGWRMPHIPKASGEGCEPSVPLRAIMAYLFTETARNFYMIHHPDEWIACVTRSQRGDCCFEINPENLPPFEQMLQPQSWEQDVSGPERMERWLDRAGAQSFDFDAGLRDEELEGPEPPDLLTIQGGNFFRGLALVDLAEAMLKRAFGTDSIAVRVNAAGQGDYFQVHVDREKADVERVKDFVRKAFYERFGLTPETPFVELHPGGGAVSCRMDRADMLPPLVRHLRALAAQAPSAGGPLPETFCHPFASVL